MPAAGWSSWNVFGGDVTASAVMGMAEVMVEKGLDKLGYVYVAIDCGWDLRTRAPNGDLQPDPKKFPNSSAVGIGQITKYTAKLWGMDYKKLQTDWKYNMANSVKIFEWGGTITSGIAVA